MINSICTHKNAMWLRKTLGDQFCIKGVNDTYDENYRTLI